MILEMIESGRSIALAIKSEKPELEPEFDDGFRARDRIAVEIDLLRLKLLLAREGKELHKSRSRNVMRQG